MTHAVELIQMLFKPRMTQVDDRIRYIWKNLGEKVVADFFKASFQRSSGETEGSLKIKNLHSRVEVPFYVWTWHRPNESRKCLYTLTN